MEIVRVGIGVIIEHNGKILVGKRINSHAPFWSIPGGKLELGETFEQCAVREIKEETNLIIHDPKVIAITNNLETYKEFGKHYASVILLAKDFTGELKLMEPEKCAEWRWVDPQNLPQPHFDASRDGVACFIKKLFYSENV
ncbi:MAG: NUDIX hydrolase [Candidatus Babeliales bacterium]